MTKVLVTQKDDIEKILSILHSVLLPSLKDRVQEALQTNSNFILIKIDLDTVLESTVEVIP